MDTPTRAAVHLVRGVVQSSGGMYTVREMSTVSWSAVVPHLHTTIPTVVMQECDVNMKYSQVKFLLCI